PQSSRTIGVSPRRWLSCAAELRKTPTQPKLILPVDCIARDFWCGNNWESNRCQGIRLVLHFINTTTFVASLFGSGEARRGSIPVPTCRDDRGATTPEPKSDATLRAAVLFGPDVVARALSRRVGKGYARRSRLVWAENPSPQTWSYL